MKKPETNLNKTQEKIVNSKEKNILVNAGAGTGKTRVLIERTQVELKESKPEDILLISFTKNAVEEIKERLKVNLGVNVVDKININTFHSLALDILKKEGILNASTIVLPEELQRNVMQEYLLEKQNVDMDGSIYDAENLVNNINIAKSHAEKQSDIKNSLFDEEDIAAYKYYKKYCKDNNFIDFNDLLLVFSNFLEKNKKDSPLKYDVILVDEFQDTSKIQHKILKNIQTKRKFYVGDIDQAIYSWRGASPEAISKMRGVKVYNLEENYRSTPSIISKSNKLIENNEERIEKTLISTKKDTGENVHVISQELANQNYQYIIKNIERLLNEGTKPNEIVILMRNNYQIKPIEKLLNDKKIPYSFLSGIKYYEREEIRIFMNLILLKEDPNSVMATMALLKALPTVDLTDKVIKELAKNARNNRVPILEELKNHNEYFDNAYDTLEILLGLDEDLNNIFKVFEESRLLQSFKERYSTQDYKEIEENLINLVKELSLMENKREFLQKMIVENDTATVNKADNIIVSTVHGVKGLEYDYVFIMDMVDGVFPSEQTYIYGKVSEEERRLFYVAMTRAKKELWILTYKLNNGKLYEPSIFLEEIMKEDIDLEESNEKNPNK